MKDRSRQQFSALQELARSAADGERGGSVFLPPPPPPAAVMAPSEVVTGWTGCPGGPSSCCSTAGVDQRGDRKDEAQVSARDSLLQISDT